MTSAISAYYDLMIQAEQKVRHRRRGSPDRPAVGWHRGGTGPPLVLINGITASGWLWPRDLIRELERSFDVIRIDSRGTGSSRDAPAPFTIADLADDVRDVLEACGHGRAIIVGYSLGGVIAQEFALRHPGALEHLILLSTIPPPPACAYPRDFAVLLRMMTGTLSPKHHMEMFLSFAGPNFHPTPGSRAEIREQLIQGATPVMGAMRQVQAVLAWRGSHRLVQVQTRTTIVNGRDDPVVPAINGQILADLIRGAQFVSLPGVGHLLPWEAPEAITDILRP